MNENLKRTNRKIIFYFVLFFLTFITVDTFFLIIAFKTHNGVITQNAYEKGLNYNQTIKLAEEQKKLGWQGQIKFNNPNLLFLLKDKNNKAIKNAKVTAYFKRAMSDKYNFQLPLVYSTNDQYETNVNFPVLGKWKIIIVTNYKTNYYQKSKTIFIN